MDENSAVHKVAIIGGGPKGLYAFERLSAQFKVSPPPEKVMIHIYNRSTFFGAGEIYRTDQPTFLITNTPIGEINMWTEDDPPPVISNPLSLTKWLYLKESTKLSEDEYIDRATVGRYLTNGFELIASNLPDNVYGKYIIGEVTDLDKDGEKYALTVKTDNGGTHQSVERYHHVLLATGHPINRLSEQDDSIQIFSDKHEEAEFIPFIYPTDYTLQHIIPDSSIGIKGMGLTFIDAVLSLTEGKGGVFKRNYNEKLVYYLSGYEPRVIYPFSRSGLPMIPRKPSFWNTTPLKFFTRQAIEEYLLDEKLDFKNQLLPLIKQDMTFTFYDIKMKRFGFKDDLDACQTFEETEEFINEFHEFYPDAKRFDPDVFLSPMDDKIFLEAKTFNQYIYDYLTFFIKEAKKGELISPWAAVTAVWRKAVPLFCELYSFGGFIPSSQQEFDSTYRGMLNRVTFGPAVESTEKLVALMEAGILHFDVAENPDLVLDDKSGLFVLNSKLYNTRRSVHTLIDARISKVSLPDDRSTLYESLLSRGEISLFQNGSDQGSYTPGSIAITPEGFVVDKRGNVNTNIVVIGTPTEGITFDNDTLSTTRNNFASKWAAFICKKCSGLAMQQNSNPMDAY